MPLFWLPHRRGFLPYSLFCGGILDQFQAERQVRVRSIGHEPEIPAAEIRHREVSFVQRGGEETASGLLRCCRAAVKGLTLPPKPLTFTGGARGIRMVILGLGCNQSCDSLLPALLSRNRNFCEFSK